MAQKTPKWHTKNREHVWERYYFLYDFFKERILLVFVHNNLGKTGVLFEKLFSILFLFLTTSSVLAVLVAFYSAKHNTRFPKKYFTECFSKNAKIFHFYDLFLVLGEKNLALQFREGRDKGQTKCFFQFFLFDFFLSSQKIFHFFSWVISF